MNYMLLWKPDIVQKLQKYLFMVLIKVQNFEQLYTCKKKPKPTKGCSANVADDYTYMQFNTNEY
jgi:hypothetical protein